MSADKIRNAINKLLASPGKHLQNKNNIDDYIPTDTNLKDQENQHEKDDKNELNLKHDHTTRSPGDNFAAQIKVENNQKNEYISSMSKEDFDALRDGASIAPPYSSVELHSAQGVDNNHQEKNQDKSRSRGM